MSPGRPFDDDEVTSTEGTPLTKSETGDETSPLVPVTAEPDEAASADEDQGEEWSDAGAPPEADAVALRALGAVSLLRRLELERRNAPLKDIEALEGWVDEYGLHASFGPSAFALFDTPPGEWTEDDVESVSWAAEELAMLGWALGRAELPPLFARADVAPLLAALPRGGDPSPFVGSASVVEPAQLDEARALYETLEEAARAEAWARNLGDDVEPGEDEQLEVVFDALADEGFDREAITREKGPTGAKVEALRRWSQVLVRQLFTDGTPHGAHRFEPAKLQGLDDQALGVFLATTQLRAETLAWLLEGDQWVDDAGEGDAPEE